MEQIQHYKRLAIDLVRVLELSETMVERYGIEVNDCVDDVLSDFDTLENAAEYLMIELQVRFTKIELHKILENGNRSYEVVMLYEFDDNRSYVTFEYIPSSKRLALKRSVGSYHFYNDFIFGSRSSEIIEQIEAMLNKF